MDAHESDRASPSNHSESNDGTNRRGRSKSSWGLSSAVHAVHGVGFVAKKVINNRLTDSLWHSKKTFSTASGPSDETSNHHTSQPLLNVEDEQTPLSTKPAHETENINVNDQLDSLKPHDGSRGGTTGSDVVDRSDGSPVKPVNQHRRPNVSNRSGNFKSSAISYVKQVNQQRRPGTTSSNVVNQSENLEPSDGSHVKPVSKHLWPGTVGSTVLNKTIHFPYISSMTPNLKKPSFPSNNSKPLPESSTDATNQASLESQPSSPHVLASRGVSPVSVAKVGPSLASLAPTNGVKTSIARGVSPTPARGISLAPARGVSPAPARGVSPAPARGVSPTPTRGVDPDVSLTSVKPYKSSGRRHFFNANILSVFTKIVDNRKEKNVTDQKVAQYLELLYNIQVQWQFANASAEAALDLQRATAERSLFDMWRNILDLRDYLASKKIDVDLLLMQLKLYAVLYRQMGFIDEWASIQKEHESALFATTNDLQARSLSVPITGGVKADIKGLKLIVFSTIQVLQATVSCIHSTVSKLDKTHCLASELANLVLHERALLDEFEILLGSTAPLHIEECSLRSYLLQSNRTSMTE
ncbi:uncharacterized protein LOC143626091 [Bidens hawaiensis]|uniref:uncharacterized protein LOC143626091 n=1 Tax=Bidens hawaiensis TaxID=980011 RepID=UPI004049F7D2